MLQQILLIAKKDFRLYFSSPIAYIILTVFLGLVGYMFFQQISVFMLDMANYSKIGIGMKPTVTTNIIQPLFANMNVIFLFMIPFITMRLLAEERKEQTAALLFTAPIKPIVIILGKYLAALALIAVVIALSFVYPAVLLFATNPDIGLIFSSYIGLFLLIATYLAAGLFWSACCENQIVAAALTFGNLLFFWLIGWAAHHAGPFWKEVLMHLSIISQFDNFSQGVIDTTNIVYYLSFIGFALFGTYILFDSNQWSE